MRGMETNSQVRALEMAIERFNPARGVALQFWSDVNMHGLNEALMYFKGYMKEDTDDEFVSAPSYTEPDLTPLTELVSFFGGELPE